MPVRILLADDHRLIRQGVRRILESESSLVVVAEASSGIEAVECATEFKPDLAIVDIGMKHLNGIEATSRIRARLPKTQVLILSMHCDERYVTQAVKAGARGYLLKDSVEHELLEAARIVAGGGSYFSPLVARVLDQSSEVRADGQAVDDRYELLTPREREIYQMLAEGGSNKEIAARLHLSLHTVETHRVRVMQKLGLHSAAELVLSAVRRGIVS